MLWSVRPRRRRGRGSRRGVPVRDRRPLRGVRGDGDRRLRGRARGGAHPQPVRDVQRRDQVRRVPAAGRRVGHGLRRDRPLRADLAGRRRGWHLLRGADPAKDQTYMLHMLGQAQLSRSLFPVGGLPKAETRRLAEAFGLPVATKPDSQELCFAPSGDAGGFVRSAAPSLVRGGGEVVDPDGTGWASMTGRSRSRSDSAVASASRSASPRTWSTWMRRRTASSWGRRCCWHGADWSPIAHRGWRGRRPPTVPSRLRCGSATRARMRRRSWSRPRGGFRVEFREPQRAVAPGQSAVVYRGEELLGGGRIIESLR